MPGEDRRCHRLPRAALGHGCAAPRSEPHGRRAAPEPSSSFSPSPIATELPWALKARTVYPDAAPKNLVQDILQREVRAVPRRRRERSVRQRRKTLHLHGHHWRRALRLGYVVTYLDLYRQAHHRLRSTTITGSTYPRRPVAMSLFFPASMEMGMGNSVPTGDVPPMWAMYQQRTRARLPIKKLNVKAADSTFAYGFRRSCTQNRTGRDPHRRRARDAHGDPLDRLTSAASSTPARTPATFHFGWRPRRPRLRSTEGGTGNSRLPQNKDLVSRCSPPRSQLPVRRAPLGPHRHRWSKHRELRQGARRSGASRHFRADQIEFLSAGDRIQSVAAKGAMMEGLTGDARARRERVESHRSASLRRTAPLRRRPSQPVRSPRGGSAATSSTSSGDGEDLSALHGADAFASDPNPARRAYAAETRSVNSSPRSASMLYATAITDDADPVSARRQRRRSDRASTTRGKGQHQPRSLAAATLSKSESSPAPRVGGAYQHLRRRARRGQTASATAIPSSVVVPASSCSARCAARIRSTAAHRPPEGRRVR